MSGKLLDSFDKIIERKGYNNRSEAIRDMVRDYIVASQWADDDENVMGTITLVYDHHVHQLSNVLAELQHNHCDSIVCTTHVHLDPHNCLEVVVVKGQSLLVRQIADQLIGARGVKHGKLVCSTTGESLV